MISVICQENPHRNWSNCFGDYPEQTDKTDRQTKEIYSTLLLLTYILLYAEIYLIPQSKNLLFLHHKEVTSVAIFSYKTFFLPYCKLYFQSSF